MSGSVLRSPSVDATNPDLSSSMHPGLVDRRRSRTGQPLENYSRRNLLPKPRRPRVAAPTFGCGISDTLPSLCRRPEPQIGGYILCRRTQKLALTSPGDPAEKQSILK